MPILPIDAQNTTNGGEHIYDERVADLSPDRAQKQWFWGTLLTQWRIYRDVLAASLTLSLLALASPLFVMQVYDRVVPTLAMGSLWTLVVGAVTVFCLEFALRTTRAHFVDLAGKKTELLLSSLLIRKVLNARLADQPVSVGVFARQFQQFDAIRELVTSSGAAVLGDLPLTLLTLMATALLCGSIVFVPITCAAVLLLHALAILPALKRATGHSQCSAAQRQATMIECLHGIESIKAKNAGDHLLVRWKQLTSRMASWEIRSRQLTNRLSAFSLYTIQMNTVLVVLVGVYQMASQQLSMGGLIAAVMLSGRALAPIARVAELTTRSVQVRSVLASIDRIASLVEEECTSDRTITKTLISEKLCFNSVSFRYPKSYKDALHDISLVIRKGEKITLTGRSGSGKSTLLQLVMRFYSPTEGEIRLDGINTQSISAAGMRRQIGYIPQQATLFFGTVRENITLGMSETDDTHLHSVAKACTVTQFTDLHPLGLDMPVAEGGANLSGGQKQCIILARALLGSPDLLLFDEPFSAMDSLTEQTVCQYLQQYAKSRTLIIATHKASLIQLVDRLTVIEQGRIVADGPKKQVLASMTASTDKTHSSTTATRDNPQQAGLG